MTRIASAPITLPKGVDLNLNDEVVEVKCSGTVQTLSLPLGVSVEIDGETVRIAQESIAANTALSGTVRANIANMVEGVSKGFEKRLTLIGVGYRAQGQGKNLNLQLGFSHPIDYPVPEGITVETPTQTEIVVRGADKQLVGQVSAEIRAFRPPEPYKGKGVRYADERVVMKEAKKK